MQNLKYIDLYKIKRAKKVYPSSALAPMVARCKFHQHSHYILYNTPLIQLCQYI